ncbi:hypothetical protein Tco_0953231 [Tanacetum coccineum]|uniref:Uncharacterized protein n=1 Tax=Tanacetum coccineum TaxID=301880 RepID=A0ABQ5DZB1_9ASTR
MSNIKKLKFPALDITGANYIQWTGYVKRHLTSIGALATIQEGNKCTEETKAKADVFLHQHIDEMLEFEYSSCDDPSRDMLEKTFSTFHASNINLQQQYRLQNFKRCGSANHWSKACRTPSHLCELYQASRKGKEKEVNHVDQFDNTNTELIASDFFNDLEV